MKYIDALGVEFPLPFYGCLPPGQWFCVTWDIKHFDPAIKLDFLFCQKFDYVSGFARGTKTETKTEFGSDFVLKTKSNCDFCKAHKPQKAKNQI